MCHWVRTEPPSSLIHWYSASPRSPKATDGRNAHHKSQSWVEVTMLGIDSSYTALEPDCRHFSPDLVGPNKGTLAKQVNISALLFLHLFCLSFKPTLSLTQCLVHNKNSINVNCDCQNQRNHCNFNMHLLLILEF